MSNRAALQNEIQALREQIGTLIGEAATAQRSLDTALSEVERQRRFHKEVVRERDRERDQLQGRVRTLERQNTRLSSLAADAEKNLSSALKEVDRLRTYHAEVVSELHGRINLLTNRADDADEQVGRLQTANDALVRQRDLLHGRIHHLERQNRLSTDRAAVVERELLNAREQIVALERTNAQAATSTAAASRAGPSTGSAAPSGGDDPELGGIPEAAALDRGRPSRSQQRVKTVAEKKADRVGSRGVWRGCGIAAALLCVVLYLHVTTEPGVAKPYGPGRGMKDGEPNWFNQSSNIRMGWATRIRAVSTTRIAMQSICAWFESAGAYLAFSFIHPLLGVFLPLVHAAIVHVAAALWAYFCYSDDKLPARPTIDFVAALLFLNVQLKAHKDLSEGLAVSWLKSRQKAALAVSAVLVFINALVFALLASFFGQVMLEAGSAVAFSLSALGSLLKGTEKLWDRLLKLYS